MNKKTDRSSRPIIIWDGECAFCARWITKWRKITGGKVEYLPFQSLEADENGRLKKIPSLSVGECKRAVQLVMPDGEVYSGAEAVFRALHSAGKSKLGITLYRHIPGFKAISECLYGYIASHRSLFSKILK